ncbi:beta-galactosidase 11-like [Canna indica]|uniref:beta-galactosidase n=1 Tax=Canna indica TaxID=4628 RepID=A0AAQ3KY69_9LILI|nr:beta-galactosidase 11-like [Canna indica]
MTQSFRVLFILLLVMMSEVSTCKADDQLGVTYDRRSLFINGKRELLFSGDIHYPRSTPAMWPDLIKKAQVGGLNVVQTYAFWNLHEPIEGQYNFEGKYDLVKFIKLIQKQGMYCTLRIGPFIEAEWNFGSIENEYYNVAKAYGNAGKTYIQWAGKMAEDLKTGVPWVMCKENSAPGAVINACNGRNCGDTFVRPDNPTKPFLWTENWTAQYRVFGDPPSQRSAEDIAYSVTRFFSKNGTLVNYYMYHGGTNFGRTSSSFVTTRYYDEAPLDEFGLFKEPKFGHLTNLHSVLQSCSEALLSGVSSIQVVNTDFEVIVYENSETKACTAFLSNSNRKKDGVVNFRGQDYFVPRRSISILTDCKTVAFNTQRVRKQIKLIFSTIFLTFHVDTEIDIDKKWQMYKEHIPRIRDTVIKATTTLELFNMTRDTTDYLWYTTSFNLENDDLPMRSDIRPVLLISSLGHALLAYVNGKFMGFAHGSNIEKSFVFQSPCHLKGGANHIAILGSTVGLPDSGAYLEHRIAGVHTIAIQGLNTGTLDLSQNLWGHQVGLIGEKLHIFNEQGIKNVEWIEAKNDMQVTWYQVRFDAPSGDDPVALDMSSMGKGMAWINGESIGRYWVSYLNPLGEPSQSVYHVPRSLLKDKDNLMVLFEEQGGRPDDILIMTVKRDNICTFASDVLPGQNMSKQWENNQLRLVAHDAREETDVSCPEEKVINSIVFASFGNPTGLCGNFTKGICHAQQTRSVVEKACLGKNKCTIPVTSGAYGGDVNCPGTTGTLAVHAKCSHKDDKK